MSDSATIAEVPAAPAGARPPLARGELDETRAAAAPTADRADSDPVVAPDRTEAAAATRAVPGPRDMRDIYLYAFIAAMVLGAWGLTRLGLYTSKSDIGYWLGVSGGVGMLMLLTYPMRKNLKFMRRMGPAKHWFTGHMVLGVGGPLLILLHSNFHIGSLNAGVAFYSMITVAVSGVVGRFLYLRLHQGLHGEKLSLEQMRAQFDSDNNAVRLRFAPAVVQRCREFEAWALNRRMVSGAEVLRTMVVMPWVRWLAARACRAELRRRLVAVAHTEGWSRRKLHASWRRACKLSDAYLAGAQRVAMFSAWERLFSWWHIAHAPIVYLLVFSAIFHVIAVHAY
jgi:hypothetical protein